MKISVRTLASQYEARMIKIRHTFRVLCYKGSLLIGDMSRIGLMCSYVRLDEISIKIFKGKV